MSLPETIQVEGQTYIRADAVHRHVHEMTIYGMTPDAIRIVKDFIYNETGIVPTNHLRARKIVDALTYRCSIFRKTGNKTQPEGRSDPGGEEAAGAG